MTELSLLLCFAVSYLLVWTPGCLIARQICGHKGQPSPMLDILTLVCVAAAGYLAFWIYLISATLGACFSILYLVGGGLWALFCYRHRLTKLKELISRPVRVTFLFGLLYLSGMTLFGGVETTPSRFVPEVGIDPPSSVFWLQSRSIDSLIPIKFAYAVAHQNPLRGDIKFGVWRFSDRPPVQVGCLLLCWPLTKIFGYGVVNLAVGVLLQVQWVLAVFAATWAMGSGRARTAFIVLAIGSTGFIYYSSVYVWPKLLAAALWLAASAPLIRIWRQRRVPTPKETVLAASGCALAFLAHGGIGFSLLAAGTLAPLYRPFRSWRFWLPGIVVAVAFYLPWAGYQKFVDPPGDRCLKLMFTGYGGYKKIDDLHWIASTGKAYSKLPWAKFAYFRKRNLALLFGDRHLDHNIAECVTGMIIPRPALPEGETHFTRRYYTDKTEMGYDLPTLAALLRYDQVEQTFRSLGFLNLAWPFLFWRVFRSPKEYLRRNGLSLVVLHTGLSLVVWWLLIFRPGHVVIRHASYGMMLALLLIAAHVLYDAPRPVRRIIFSFHVIFNVVLWVVFVPTDFGRQLLHLQAMPGLAPLFGAVLAAVGIVYFSVRTKTSDWWDEATLSADDPAPEPFSPRSIRSGIVVAYSVLLIAGSTVAICRHSMHNDDGRVAIAEIAQPPVTEGAAQ